MKQLGTFPDVWTIRPDSRLKNDNATLQEGGVEKIYSVSFTAAHIAVGRCGSNPAYAALVSN